MPRTGRVQKQKALIGGLLDGRVVQRVSLRPCILKVPVAVDPLPNRCGLAVFSRLDELVDEDGRWQAAGEDVEARL